MCSLSRYVLVAGVVGVLASLVTGSDVVGWMAAAAAVLLTYAAGRRFPGRFGAGSCELPVAAERTAERTVETTEDGAGR